MRKANEWPSDIEIRKLVSETRTEEEGVRALLNNLSSGPTEFESCAAYFGIEIGCLLSFLVRNYPEETTSALCVVLERYGEYSWTNDT